jgi:hypothetical protein
MQSNDGFSLPELLIIILIPCVVSSIGFFVYEHKHAHTVSAIAQAQKLESTFTYSRGSMPNADAQSIAGFFQSTLTKNFQTVGSFDCGDALNETCSAPPPNEISVTETGDNYDASPRKVAGYDFYVAPDTYISDQTSSSAELDIITQSKPALSALNDFLHNQIADEGFSNSSSLLDSQASPNMLGTTVFATFYNNATLCEIDEAVNNDGSSSDSITCAPLNLYSEIAQMLQPLYKVFISAMNQYRNPEQTGIWLSFSPNETAEFDSYIMNSKTAGYKIGSIEIDFDSTKKSNYNPSNNGEVAYFWQKDGGSWDVLTKGNSLLTNDSNNAFLTCSDTFPSEDAQNAFIGQPCVNDDQTASQSTFN